MIELVADHTWLDADTAAGGIHCEDTSEVPRDIDNETVADALPCKRGASRARDQPKTIAPREFDDFTNVSIVRRKHDPSRHFLILRSIRRIETTQGIPGVELPGDPRCELAERDHGAGKDAGLKGVKLAG